MSQENVDVIWRQNAAVRRGDLDPLAATIDPHILIRTDARWPEQRIYGREPALAWYGGFLELWGTDYRIEEVTDLGARVLRRIRVHDVGPGRRASGRARRSHDGFVGVPRDHRQRAHHPVQPHAVPGDRPLFPGRFPVGHPSPGEEELSADARGDAAARDQAGVRPPAHRPPGTGEHRRAAQRFPGNGRSRDPRSRSTCEPALPRRIAGAGPGARAAARRAPPGGAGRAGRLDRRNHGRAARVSQARAYTRGYQPQRQRHHRRNP